MLLIADSLSKRTLFWYSRPMRRADNHAHTRQQANVVGKALGHAAVVLVAIAKFLGTFVCTILASAGVAAVAPLIASAVARTREGVGAALLAGCCCRRGPVGSSFNHGCGHGSRACCSHGYLLVLVVVVSALVARTVVAEVSRVQIQFISCMQCAHRGATPQQHLQLQRQ